MNDPQEKEETATPVGRPRRRPATIRQRTEPDPVDVALADDTDTGSPTRRPDTVTADDSDTDSDSGADTDTDSRRTPPRQRHGDTTAPTDTTSPRPTPTRRPDRATPTVDADSTPPTTPTPESPMSPTAAPPTAPDVMSPLGGESMKSASFSLPPSLIERVRAAQWHTQLKPDGHHNVSELVRRVLLEEVERLESTYNRGRPFPRVEKLRSGPSPRGAARGAQIRASNRRRNQADDDGREAEAKRQQKGRGSQGEDGA